MSFLIFATITCCNSHTQPILPKEFSETSLPDLGSESWRTLNYSNNEFEVKNLKGKLKVDKVDDVHTSELMLSKGKLLGEDHGEFGGKLTFIPFDKPLDSIEIKQGNIKYLFRFKDSVYFIEGLDHGSINEGALYKLNTSTSKFTYLKVLDFEDAPEAYTIFNDKILIASQASFYVLKDFNKQKVVDKTFWNGLYPNSIAAFNDTSIYIGMRGGIAKLNLQTKKINFYRYNK